MVTIFDYYSLLIHPMHILTLFLNLQGPPIGDHSGDVYAALCNLRPAIWTRSFLYLSVVAGRSFLYNGIWASGNNCTLLKLKAMIRLLLNSYVTQLVRKTS